MALNNETEIASIRARLKELDAERDATSTNTGNRFDSIVIPSISSCALFIRFISSLTTLL